MFIFNKPLNFSPNNELKINNKHDLDFFLIFYCIFKLNFIFLEKLKNKEEWMDETNAVKKIDLI